MTICFLPISHPAPNPASLYSPREARWVNGLEWFTKTIYLSVCMPTVMMFKSVYAALYDVQLLVGENEVSDFEALQEQVVLT